MRPIVTSDLNTLFNGLKKKSIIMCDDYADKFCIPEVREAINDFSKKKYSEAKQYLSP